MRTYDEMYKDSEASLIICGILVFVNSLFCILEASLYASMDFTFLAKCSFLVMVIIYLPLASLAYFYFNTVVSMLIAYSFPILILVILYLWRMFWLILPNLDVHVELSQPLLSPSSRHFEERSARTNTKTLS